MRPLSPPDIAGPNVIDLWGNSAPDPVHFTQPVGGIGPAITGRRRDRSADR